MKNEFYFKVIDSEDKAYFLGLLYADGCNSSKLIYTHSRKGSKQVCISLQEKDGYILEELQRRIEGGVISYINKSIKNLNWKNCKSFTISSNKISEDLDKLGCTANKTKFLQFPKDNIIPKELISHFIRGFFDGDGSIWDSKRKVMTVKDKNRKLGYRDRIIHNVKFNFTGTTSMMIGIQTILIKELGFKKNKLNTSKNIENCVQLEYSGRQQIKKFYNYLYNNSTLYLTRKKSKFESIINCANIQ